MANTLEVKPDAARKILVTSELVTSKRTGRGARRTKARVTSLSVE
jgi:hypothetical protein